MIKRPGQTLNLRVDVQIRILCNGIQARKCLFDPLGTEPGAVATGSKTRPGVYEVWFRIADVDFDRSFEFSRHLSFSFFI